MRLKLVFITCFLLWNMSSAIWAQQRFQKVDSLLQNTFVPDEPGAVFLVSKGGKLLYKKAFGLANVELKVPMNTEQVFQIGSMTKQFTAVAILLLEAQGKLSVQDEITQFIPDYPIRGHNFTLHHLLTHTSGIKDFTRMKSIMSIAKQDLSPKELVDFFKDEPVDFLPGEQFKYNNSGYALLGYVIELVSGERYADFIERHIFQKIGMKDSRYASDRAVILNRAYGYHQRNGFTNKMHISLNIPYASGSLMSTLDDLVLWQHALTQHTILKKESLEKAFQQKYLNSGAAISYGYGWHIKDWDGITIREHGGSVFGFKSMAVYVPSEDLYVVGLTNCDCKSPTAITRTIAQLFIPKTNK